MEELLAEMREAREYGVPGTGAREIAAVERKRERVVRRNRENMRAVARMFLDHFRTREILPASHNILSSTQCLTDFA